MTRALKALRARRNQRGFAMPMALILVMLMSTLSLVVVGAAKSSISTGRGGRAFIDARQAADQALASALYSFNKDSSPVVPFPGGTGTNSGSGTWRGASWSWSTSTASGRTITVTGTANGKTFTETYPLRAQYVGSQAVDASGNVAYGITATGPALDTSDTTLGGFPGGAWDYAIATAADSVYRGAVTHRASGSANADWAALGGTVAWENTSGVTAVPNVVTYADSAGAVEYTNPAVAKFSQRSRANLFFDLAQIQARADDARVGRGCVPYTKANWENPANTSFCAVGNTTQVDSFFKHNRTLSTITVVGNLTIPYDIRPNGFDTALEASTGRYPPSGNPATHQVHIHVTGNVIFTRSGYDESAAFPAHRYLYGTFIFAPYGSCTVTTKVRLQYRGSLACKSFVADQSNYNEFRWRRPLTQPAPPAGSNIAAPRAVYFTEQTGFVDARIP